MKKGKLNRWKYKGIDANSGFAEAAQKILKRLTADLTTSIKTFLGENSMENLHQIRISARRLRYNMETFRLCFDKKKYTVFYGMIEQMQDLTGRKRDLDVMYDNIKNISVEQNMDIGDELFVRIDEQRSMLNDTLKLELFQYIHSGELKDFMNMLNKKGD